jgi:hypothetical protein
VDSSLWPILLAGTLTTGLLLIKRRQRHTASIGTVGLFLFVAGLWGLLSLIQAASFVSLQLVASALTLALLAWLVIDRTRRAAEVLAPLLVLTLGVQGVSLVYRVYGAALFASEVSIALQALVLLIALGWDLMLSGKHVTNVDGKRIHRHVRMLLYFGYVMLVSSTVLYFGAYRNLATNEPAIQLFEPESFVRWGILGLGVPLLLTGFLLSVSQAWSTTAAGGSLMDNPAQWRKKWLVGALRRRWSRQETSRREPDQARGDGDRAAGSGSSIDN